MYRSRDRGVIRLLDGAVIPNDSKNKDWIEYQIWVSKGNIPEPKEEPVIIVNPNKEKYQKATKIDEKVAILAEMLGIL